MSFVGEAVSAGGAKDAPVGLAPNNGLIEYFIPLKSTYAGTYGAAGLCGSGPGSGVGTCSDYGQGIGHSDGSALKMNIFFDMTGQPDSATAELDLFFKDLDLDPVNDPDGFHESILFSYWDGASFQPVSAAPNTAITTTAGLTSSPFDGGKASTNLPPLASQTPSNDPFTWTLDLGMLGILPTLNQTVANSDGFWIQLGFGSKYCPNGYCKKGKNTPEFLKAELHVSPVPLPSAVWLFGSALLGFIGMSRRTRV